MIVVLGTPHTGRTPGKRDPEGNFREPVYCRELVTLIKPELEKCILVDKVFIDYEPLEPKEEWISKDVKTEQARELNYRVRVVNDICNKYGKNNVIYISLHNDAAGSGAKWLTAGGFSVYTTKGRTKSDIVSECICNAAEINMAGYAKYMEEKRKEGFYDAKQKPFRTDTTDGDKDKEADYFVLKNTLCPAVLVENLFQDNKADVAYLRSAEGKQSIVNTIVDGTINYIKQYG